MVLYSLSNTPKPTWHPRKGHACLEKNFQSNWKKKLFEISSSDSRYSNLFREEWQAVRFLADDRIIAMQKTDKGYCVVVVVWYKNAYLLKAEK